MAFYVIDPLRGRLGPYSAEELRQLHLSGALSLEARIGADVPDGAGSAGGPEKTSERPALGSSGDATVPFRSLWEQWERAAEFRGSPPPLPLPPPSGAGPTPFGEPASGAGRTSIPPPLPPGGAGAAMEDDSFAERAGDDLRVMLPHLTLPLDELRNAGWLKNRRALAIAAVGLLPLIIYGLFRHPSQLGNAFWAMALYFSALWALFFYYVFPTPDAKVSTSAVCFFVTGVVSVSALLVLYQVWPLSALSGWIQSPNVLIQWAGFVLGVGLPEELCKAFVLLVLLRRAGPFRPQTLLFYGLMSGLGFGIYEGVKYQTAHNFEFAIRTAGQPDAYFAAEYYLLNLIRLTTLPFLHAIWTGMAGYFIGFAGQYPERSRGLLLVAIGLPAFLHGTYNAFSNTLGLVLALISVLALNLYLAKSVEFEKILRRRPPL